MTSNNVVVMLDGGCAFKDLEDKDVEILLGCVPGHVR